MFCFFFFITRTNVFGLSGIFTGPWHNNNYHKYVDSARSFGRTDNVFFFWSILYKTPRFERALNKKKIYLFLYYFCRRKSKFFFSNIFSYFHSPHSRGLRANGHCRSCVSRDPYNITSPRIDLFHTLRSYTTCTLCNNNELYTSSRHHRHCYKTIFFPPWSITADTPPVLRAERWPPRVHIILCFVRLWAPI